MHIAYSKINQRFDVPNKSIFATVYLLYINSIFQDKSSVLSFILSQQLFFC